MGEASKKSGFLHPKMSLASNFKHVGRDATAVRNFDLDPVIESHQAWFLLFISRIQVCLFGGFLGHGGTPSYQCYSRIFHEINQAAIGAIGDLPWLRKPHLRVAIKLFKRLLPRTANTEAWSASNKAVEKVLRPAGRRKWAIPSRHHSFQYEKGHPWLGWLGVTLW